MISLRHAAEWDEIPDTWSPEVVLLRFFEAYDTERRLPPDRGPRGIGGGWPTMLSTIGIEPEERDPRRWAPSFRRRQIASSAAIMRFEQTLDWTCDILVGEGSLDEAQAVWCLVLGRLGRSSVQDRFARLGFSRPAGYRWAERGIRRVADALQARGARLLLPDLAQLRQIGLIPAQQTSSSDGAAGKHDLAWRAPDASGENLSGRGLAPAPMRTPSRKGRRQEPAK